MRADGIDEVYLDLLHDPQSSGGLLFSVPESCVDRIMDEFARADMNTRVTVIGKAVARGDEYIRLLPGKSGVMV